VTPFIPHTSSPPPRCPGCNHIESTVEVCRNCGYQYADGGMSDAVFVALILLGSLFALYVGTTLTEWMMFSEGRSLREVLKAQWKHLASLRF